MGLDCVGSMSSFSDAPVRTPAAICFASETRIACSGAPLLDDGLVLEPVTAEVWRGPALLGDARYLGSQLLVGSADREADRAGGNPPPGGPRSPVAGGLPECSMPTPLVGRRRLAPLT